MHNNYTGLKEGIISLYGKEFQGLIIKEFYQQFKLVPPEIRYYSIKLEDIPTHSFRYGDETLFNYLISISERIPEATVKALANNKEVLWALVSIGGEDEISDHQGGNNPRDH